MSEAVACPQLDRVVARHNELRRAAESGRAQGQATDALFSRNLSRLRAIVGDIAAQEALEAAFRKRPPPPASPVHGIARAIDAAAFNRPFRTEGERS